MHLDELPVAAAQIHQGFGPGRHRQRGDQRIALSGCWRRKQRPCSSPGQGVLWIKAGCDNPGCCLPIECAKM